MYDIQKYSGKKKIPLIHQAFEITIDGELFNENGISVNLEQFNEITKLQVKDVLVLSAISYQQFYWPPAYWKHLVALKMVEGVETPEALMLGIEQPVESLEYPGFFMIPYFSNYVISKEGRLIKKSKGQEIQSSSANTDYWTLRMAKDSHEPQNYLRHRILCFAFKPYPANVEDLEINHIDAKRGVDNLDNLEWCTHQENITHAVEMGTQIGKPVPIQVKNIKTGMTFIFGTCSEAGKALELSAMTVRNRARSLGYKAYDGFQFRLHPNLEPWPDFERLEGKFLVEFLDGTSMKCSTKEAAMHAGVSRTSLLRLLREGRCYGTTLNKITRLN